MKWNVFQAAVNPAENDIPARNYRRNLTDLFSGSEVVRLSLKRLRPSTRSSSGAGSPRCPIAAAPAAHRSVAPRAGSRGQR